MTKLLQEVFRLHVSIPPMIRLLQTSDIEHDIIMAEPAEFQKAIIHILSNAIYEMRKTGGRLEIRLSSGKLKPQFAQVHNLSDVEHLRISIKDSGKGVPSDIMGHIFEPFFTTKPVGEGLGMGLAVTHGIIKNHKGTLTVRSGKKGSTFNIYVPLIITS